MAQRLSTSFVNTNIPGAYPDVTVKSTPVGITSTGDIVIIGEAEGGADYTQEKLADNFFTPTQLDRVAAKYLRGPIVDAMRALTSPSNDTNITGSTGKVYVVKTNAGTRAQAIVENYGTVKSKNYGIDGNKYYYQVTQVEDEVAPIVIGAKLDVDVDNDTLINPLQYENLSFEVRLYGGLVIAVSTGTGATTVTDLATNIGSSLPASLMVANEEGSLAIFVDEDVDANQKGWGKSFEIIESNTGDLGVLGLSQGLAVSSQEPEIEFSVKRQDTNTNESFAVESEIALTIGYEGTEGQLSIVNGVLTTTVVGGSGSNLSIDLSEYSTMSDLASYISSQAGYSATSISSSNNLSPLRLDEIAGFIGIASSIGAEPGRIKKAAYNFSKKISESSVVDFEFSVGAGLPAAMDSAIYLSGGAKGSTSAADIVGAIPALEGIKVNFVVPLFSRDASEDIADGLTDSSSTYTIDAINFAVKSHVLAMSTVKVKRNRIAILSKQGTYAEAKAHSQSLASFRSVVAMQTTTQVDALGNVKEFQPWHTAAIIAGMQSAGFYRSLTNKFANVISFKDPVGFDSGNIGDVEDGIDAGLMFLQKETAGNKFVVDQTTYGFDTNFVYNSLQAVYMSDVLAIQLAESLEKFVVGKSLADVNAAGISGFIAKKMEEFRKLKIIGASDDAPLGYKNLTININGPIAEVKLEAKLTTAILFIPIQLELSQIQSSSEG